MKKPTLVVLAAGMGSRYGGVKQIEPVGPAQEIILEYSIYDALRAGFGKVVCVIRRAIEADFREHVVSRFDGKLPVEFVFQEMDDLPGHFALPADRTKPWGTAHAIWAARKVVNEPFAVINADDFYGADAFLRAYEFLSVQDGSKLSMCMVGYVLGNTVSEHGSVARGLCETDADSFLLSIEEHTKISQTDAGIESLLPDGSTRQLSGEELVSMNFFGFTPQIFGEIESAFEKFLSEFGQNAKAECYIPTVVNDILQRGTGDRLKVLRSSADWFGITYREDLPAVQSSVKRLVQAGQYAENLWQ